MSHKTLTPYVAAALAVFALAGGGCTTSNNPQFANKDTNFLGIWHEKPNSFAFTPPTTAVINLNDVITNPNPSGTQVTILEGLVTYKDY